MATVPRAEPSRKDVTMERPETYDTAPPGRKRTHQTMIRWTLEELEEAKRKAARAGLTLSAYIRNLVMTARR